MLAWMYRAGAHVEEDGERSRLWLEKAAEAGHAPSLNDLAVTMLTEADALDAKRAGATGVGLSGSAPGAGTAAGPGNHLQGSRQAGAADAPLPQTTWADIVEDVVGERGGQPEAGTAAGATRFALDEEKERDGSDGPRGRGFLEGSGDLAPRGDPSRRTRAVRRRAMRLLLLAAKEGYTEAMTNLGNMQEALGNFREARAWYR